MTRACIEFGAKSTKLQSISWYQLFASEHSIKNDFRKNDFEENPFFDFFPDDLVINFPLLQKLLF